MFTVLFQMNAFSLLLQMNAFSIQLKINSCSTTDVYILFYSIRWIHCVFSRCRYSVLCLMMFCSIWNHSLFYTRWTHSIFCSRWICLIQHFCCWSCFTSLYIIIYCNPSFSCLIHSSKGVLEKINESAKFTDNKETKITWKKIKCNFIYAIRHTFHNIHIIELLDIRNIVCII